MVIQHLWCRLASSRSDTFFNHYHPKTDTFLVQYSKCMVFISPKLMGGYQVSCSCVVLSVCLSVYLRCISFETAKLIRLKFCVGIKVSPGHHISHLGGKCSRDWVNGWFFFWLTVLLFDSHYFENGLSIILKTVYQTAFWDDHPGQFRTAFLNMVTYGVVH